MTHICVSKLIIIGSDTGLSTGRRQAIIWTNAKILLVRPLGTNFSEISIEIHIFSFKKMYMKMSSGNWQPSCPGLNVLIIYARVIIPVLNHEIIEPLSGSGTKNSYSLNPIILPVMGLVCLFGNFKQRNFPQIIFDCIIQYWILIHWKYHIIGPFWPYKHCSAKYLSRPSYAHINETSNCFHISDKVTLIWLGRPYLMCIKRWCISEAVRSLRARASEVLKHIEGRGTLQNETFASYSQPTQYRCHCIIWGCNGH